MMSDYALEMLEHHNCGAPPFFWGMDHFEVYPDQPFVLFFIKEHSPMVLWTPSKVEPLQGLS